VSAAATVAFAASIVSGISRARLGALLENTRGYRRWALKRYFDGETQVHGRWRALRALGLSSGTLVLASGFEHWLITVALVTITYVVFSQLGAALLRPATERVTPTLLVLLYPAEMLVMVLVDPIVALTRALALPIKHSIPPGRALAEAEVELVVNEGEQSGSLDHDQSEMIRNVLEFGDTEASDLMVPRPQIQALNLNATPENILQMVIEQAHSRYPVYRDSIDEVVGILHIKDFFLFTATHPLEEVVLEQLLRSPVFVPEGQLASSVLQELRAGGHHMAIVLDEFGGVAGVLTLEDLLEEIVGEIQDEHDDDDDAPIVKLSNGHFAVDASIPVTDLNRQLGIELPDREEYNSLGGYIVEEMGRVPEAGTTLDRAGHRFVIRIADERHVSRVDIIPPVLRASA
jgi:CBS domain containing-hemolysin-like protein